EFYDSIFNINVKGVLFTVQKALPLLPDGVKGVLFTVESRRRSWAPSPVRPGGWSSGAHRASRPRPVDTRPVSASPPARGTSRAGSRWPAGGGADAAARPAWGRGREALCAP